jgi:uncharacterized surface anchored protein
VVIRAGAFTRRIAIAGIAIACALIWAVGAFRAPGASAAEIDGAITAVSIHPTSAGPFDPLTVDVDWSVPPGAKAGDTFTLTLPAKLTALDDAFDLKDASGHVIATAVVKDGVVTFTLTDFVDTHVDVSGTAFFSVHFDLSKIPGPGPVQLDFASSTKVFPGTVTMTGSGIQDRNQGAKYGSWTDPSDQGVTHPTDALTFGLESPQGPFHRVVMTDDGGPGMAFDCATIGFYHAFSFDAYGRLVGVTPLPAAQIISQSCTTSTLKVVVGPLAKGEIVGVSYQSTITDPGLASYTNTATVSANEDSEPVSATVARYDDGGSGSGSTPSPTSTSPTTSASPTTSVSPTSTSTSSTSTSSTSSSTSSTTTTGSATVLPTQLTSSPPSTAAGSLPFTGADVAPMLGVAAVLLGGGALLLLAGRRQRKH